MLGINDAQGKSHTPYNNVASRIKIMFPCSNHSKAALIHNVNDALIIDKQISDTRSFRQDKQRQLVHGVRDNNPGFVVK